MEKRTEERYKRNIIRVSRSTLDWLKKKGSELPELGHFFQILEDTFVTLKATEDTYIGSYCVMVPDELIHALGFKPLRLCAGHSIAALIGDELVPRDACPVVKASVGFHAMRVMPVYEQCSLAVLPMTCDAKRKSAAVLEKYLNVLPFPVPAEKSDGNFERSVHDMWGMVKSISALTGNQLSNKALVQAYRDINAAQKEAYKLYAFLRVPDPPVLGSQVMAVMNSYCYDTPKEWAVHVRALNAKLFEKQKERAMDRRKKPRILIAGSPITFPNFKLPLLLEGLGAQIVGDETCMAGRLLYDPVVPDDLSTAGMIRALTARHISACTCPVFGQTDDRVCSMTQKIHDTGAEGIVYHVLRGCTPYDYEVHVIEQLAYRLDLPMIRVETDFSEEDTEQVRVRLEAFCEMIEERRTI